MLLKEKERWLESFSPLLLSLLLGDMSITSFPFCCSLFEMGSQLTSEILFRVRKWKFNVF